MSEVLCTKGQIAGGGGDNQARDSMVDDLRGRAGRMRPSERKESGPATPNRPAIAFLVTPKLPLGGRSEKLISRTRSIMTSCSSNQTLKFMVELALSLYFKTRYKSHLTVRNIKMFPGVPGSVALG
jgi:hypothetical protein